MQLKSKFIFSYIASFDFPETSVLLIFSIMSAYVDGYMWMIPVLRGFCQPVNLCSHSLEIITGFFVGLIFLIMSV